MPLWRDDYIQAIKEAEKNSPVNVPLVEACSHLQDRVAALEAEKANQFALSSDKGSKGLPDSEADEHETSRLRLELAEALRSQGQLQSRLAAAEEELETLRHKTKNDARVIRSLTSERSTLLTKVKDRDEELRGKLKLVENVQDELIALNLQLNIAEQQRAKVRAENKELVERWMKRVGQEADAMNLANEN